MSARLLSSLCVAFAVVATASSQRIQRELVGDTAGDGFGSQLAILGDTDGNGRPDVIVGAPLADAPQPDAGYVRVYQGRNGAVLKTIRGTTANQRVGRRVSAAGDVDGDGLRDVLVDDAQNLRVYAGGRWVQLYAWPTPMAFAGGADANRDGHDDFLLSYSTATQNRVLIRSGKTGLVLHTINGGVPTTGFGASLAWIGDLDSDGCNEFIVGSVGQDHRGAAAVYSGRTGAPIKAQLPVRTFSRFGQNCIAAGDFNHDGWPDYAIAAPLNVSPAVEPSTVHVFSGRDHSRLRTIHSMHIGGRYGVGYARDLGAVMARALDVDGDDYDDLVLSSSAHVSIVSGRDGSDLFRFYPSEDGFGRAIDAGSDLDGDGTYDFVLGGTDRVRIVSGPESRIRYRHWCDLNGLTGFAGSGSIGDIDGDGRGDYAWAKGYGQTSNGMYLSAQASLISGATGRRFGAVTDPTNYTFTDDVTIAPLGRIDGDNRDDFAVSWRDGGGRSTVAVYSGASHNPIRTHNVPSGATEYGTALLGGFDWDRDRTPDLAIGCTDGGANGGGFVEIRSGRTGALLKTVHGDSSGDLFGHALALVGDVDRDGRRDLAVGAPKDDDGGTDAGSVRVFSMGSARALLTRHGTVPGMESGTAIAAIGHINRDGVLEVAVGAPGTNSGAGRVSVLSGANGSLIYYLSGTPGQRFGERIAAGQDLDADNHPELAIGGPGDGRNGPTAGSVTIVSPGKRTTLETFVGDRTKDRFGSWVAWCPDFTGDGQNELLVGAPKGGHGSGAFVPTFGYAHAFQLPARGALGTFGHGCYGVRGRPQLRMEGSATFGQRVDLITRQARPNAPAAYEFGLSRTQWGMQSLPMNLDAHGFDGCLLLVAPQVEHGTTTTAAGTSSLSLLIPTNTSLIGVPVYVQHVTVDAQANAAGIALSNAGWLAVGH